MDKNTVIGFTLMALVLIGYSYYTRPSEEQIRERRIQDSLALVAKEKAEQVMKEKRTAGSLRAAGDTTLVAKGDTTGLFAPSTGKAQMTTLKNGKVEISISSQGGTPAEAHILGYKDLDSTEYITLFTEQDQGLTFMLSGKTENIITRDLSFTPSNVSDSTVTMTATASNGGKVVIDYKLNSDYLLNFNIRTEGLDGIFHPNTDYMDVQWQEMCRTHEKGFTFENRYTSLTYKFADDDDTDYINEGSETVDEEIEKPLDWVAFKNQFFAAILITKQQFKSGARLTSLPQEKGTPYLKQFEAKLRTNFDPKGTPTEFEMYFGPNDFQILQQMEDETTMGKKLSLRKLVYLGWPIVRLINRWFTVYVFDWLTKMHINMGIVLILITLLLKAITFPLVKKSYLSSAKMRVLKPKLDEATKQYNKPEDQMMKQQAMMQMYSQYGVSPLGGCLPMLIQMPIWIAMFNFVPNAIQLRGESFLWIKDLSTYDPIIEWSHNLPLIGDHISLTCLLFCGSNVLYSIMTMRQQQDQMVGMGEQQQAQMKMMRWMMMLMPVMFFFMFNDYSSGLNFYYFISLLFSATIMWLLRKTTNDEKLLAILEKRYKENKNNPKKQQGGFAERIAEMQRQTEELRKQRMQNKK